MRNLILISFLFIVLQGCNISLFNSYTRVKEKMPDTNVRSYFSNPDSNYLYQADIRFMKNYYSGIVAIKPQADSSHRIVFITEMGIKIFDYEIKNPLRTKDYYKVNYMMEPLSKKVIQKTLANDFGLLLQNADGLPYSNFKDKNEQRIIRIKHRGLRYLYCYGKSNRDYNKILVKSALFKKVDLKYYGIENSQPDSVKISHYGIKLNYAFRKLIQ